MKRVNVNELRNFILTNSAIAAVAPKKEYDSIAAVFGRMVGGSKEAQESAQRWACPHSGRMNKEIEDHFRALCASRMRKYGSLRGDEWTRCVRDCVEKYKGIRAKEMATIQANGHYARKAEAQRTWYRVCFREDNRKANRTPSVPANKVIRNFEVVDKGQAKLMEDRDAAWNHARACGQI